MPTLKMAGNPAGHIGGMLENGPERRYIITFVSLAVCIFAKRRTRAFSKDNGVFWGEKP